MTMSYRMSKKSNPRVTVRLPDPALAKLDRLAVRVTPKGESPNRSRAIRNLIEKEKI